MSLPFDRLQEQVAKLERALALSQKKLDEAQKEARAANTKAERLEREGKREASEAKKANAALTARLGKAEQNLLKVALQSEKAAADLLQKVGQRLRQVEGQLGDFLGLDGEGRAGLRQTADTLSGAGSGAKAGSGAGARLGGAFGPAGAAVGGLVGGLAGGVAGGVVGSNLEPKRRAAARLGQSIRNRFFRQDQANEAAVEEAQAGFEARDARAELVEQYREEQRRTLIGQGDPSAKARLLRALRRTK